MIRAAKKRRRNESAPFQGESGLLFGNYGGPPTLHTLEARLLMSSEIDVLGNALSILDGDVTPSLTDHTIFGNANIAGSTITRTFTIKNLGDTTLNLSGDPVIQIIGTNAADFSVAIQPGSTLDPAGEVTFDVTFDPSATGSRTATIRIFNDDGDESLYDFAISGTGTSPEIDVQGNATSIADGDVTPRPQDFTDFRQVPVSSTATQTVTRTFTIRNTGATELSLLGTPRVTISGAHAADFTVTTQPATGTIAGGANTTFIITFNPSAAGLRTATVTITNDDADESTYDFAIQGTGIVTDTAGSGLQTATLQAGTGTGATNGTGLSVIYTGYLTTGAQFDSNVGGTPFSLTLGTSNVIQGWHQGLQGIKIGEKRTLVIPPALAYGNNPPSGSGIPAGATLIFEIERVAPDIALGSPQGSTVVPIADGDTTPSTADHTDMGPVTLGDGKADADIFGNPVGIPDGVGQWTFRITATSAINLTGNTRVVISGADSSAFSVVSQPPAAIVPGSGQATATRDFTINFNPSRLGVHNATVTIASDDPDENPYTFAISGTGIANRLSGAVEDTDYIVTHSMLNDVMKESGSSTYRIESVESGQLFKNGVPVEAGVTTISSGQSLTWKPAANATRTTPAFTVIAMSGTTPVGAAEPLRVEITPIDDTPTGAIDDITLPDGADQTVNLTALFSDADISGTIARIVTSLGAIDVHLFNSATPLTVANFLNYATGGDWANTIIHRVVTGFVVQGGGFKPQLPASHITTDPAVANEFRFSSQRGTIAMAKSGNQPDSATSEWFFNLDDNAANLDNQNGGFTVFGEIVGDGMTVVEDIASTPLFTDGTTLTNLPLRNYSGGAVQDANWIKTISVSTISNLSFSVVGNTNPDLVTPSITGGSLDLDIPSGLAGSSDITIRATDLTGRTFDTTFTVTVVGVSVEAVDDQAAEPSGPQPADPGRFRITRTGSTDAPLTVNYAITGTAINGTDFATTEVTAIIPAGKSFIDIDITPLIDGDEEGLETVVLTLESGSYLVTGDPATVSIFDDKPIVTVVATDNAAAETTGAQTADGGLFTITRTGATDEELTVFFTITGTAVNGTDYSVITQEVIIPIGESSITVAVNVTDDSTSEFGESVTLSLNSDDDYVIGVANDDTVTITDNDAVLVQISAVDASLAEVSPVNPGVFRISRTGSTTNALAVKFTRGGAATFGPAGDYTLSVDGVNLTTTTISIPAGEQFVDVTVNVNNDTKADLGEAVLMTLAAGPGYVLPAVVGDRTASMTILDDEPIVSVASLGFTGADAEAAETNDGESSNRAIFRIFRTGPTNVPLTVKFGTKGTAKRADYTLSAGGVTVKTTVTIPIGADHVDVFVNPNNDVIVEPTKTVILNLAANTSAYNLDPDAADRTASATVLDNEPFISVAAIGYSGADAAAAETNSGESANTGKFRISRTTTGPALTVNVKFTGTAKRGTSFKQDYFITINGQLVTKNKIVIPNGATFVDVVVNAINDTLPEGSTPETVIMTLTKATKNYKLDPDAADLTATVTVADNEPIISITAVDATASEPGGDANVGKFRISRTGSTATNIHVPFKITGTAANGTDYVKLLTTVTIVIGQSFVDFDIQPLIDSLTEGPETVTVTLAAGSGFGIDAAASAATVTIANGEAEAGPDVVILTESHNGKLIRVFTADSALGISGTVKNQGTAATGAAFQIRALLSRDRAVSAEDIVLGVMNVGALAAGATAGFSGSFNVDDIGLAPVNIGDHYVILVADIGGVITEIIETNNTFASLLANVVIIA